MTTPADRAFLNYARGGRRYIELRWRIAANVLTGTTSQLQRLPTSLRKSFFKLAKGFVAIDIGEKDWRFLAKFQDGVGSAVEDSLVSLVVDYALENKDRVGAICAADKKVSLAILEERMDDIILAFNELNNIDRQSLWGFRLFSARNASDYKVIVEHFSKNAHSDWITKEFLYPLIFYSINQPNDDFFPEMLTQIFPEYSQNIDQRRLVTFLLRDDLAAEISLAYKCYVGLISHPYDAIEMLASHLELTIAQGHRIRPSLVDILRPLADAFPLSRFPALLDLISGPPAFGAQQTQVLAPWMDGALDLTRSLFESNWSNDAPAAPARKWSVLCALHALRWTRYPTYDEFCLVDALARRYLFTSAGRAVSSLMTGLYMWERASQAREVNQLIWQFYLVRQVTPFLLSSPSGDSARALDLFGTSLSAHGADVSSYLDNAGDESRMWIKRFHWQQHANIDQMRLKDWSAAVRQTMPLSCNNRFLSGVSWSWLQEVIAAYRIRPFRAEPDAIYVLFLRFIEEMRTEDSTLNNAIGPIARNYSNLEDFVTWLVSEYGAAALGIVRIYLQPSTILRLRLEPTFMAALTERVAALEALGEHYGFPADLMTREQLAAEQLSLVTTVTMSSLGAHQFEVPWALLKQQALRDATEHHKAYLALSESYRELPLLGQALKRGHVSFANKQSREYEVPNSAWPLTQVISMMIDTFLSHPSYGIEAILAVRIRHDHMRREFADALGALKRTAIAGLAAADRFELLPYFEQPVYDSVQRWIDNYMHTGTSGRSAPVFEFLPTQSELETLMASIPDGSEAGPIVDIVYDWLQSRLEMSLGRANALLDDDLIPDLRACVNQTCQTLLDSQDQGAVEKITRVVETTVVDKAKFLHEWFDWQTQERGTSVNYRGIAAVVHDRFRGFENLKGLSIYLGPSTIFDDAVPPESVKQVYDIWSEMVFNAIKYSKRDYVRIRVKPFENATACGFLFSSLGDAGTISDRVIDGDPGSTVDGQFRDRSSGHPKVAAIAAALARRNVSVRAIGRGGSYHVFMPMLCDETANRLRMQAAQ